MRKLCAFVWVIATLSGCGPRFDESGNSLQTVREVNTLFDAIAQNEITRNPELATHLGLREDVTNFSHNEALNDRSQAAYEHMRLKRFEVLTALNALEGQPNPGSELDTHLKTVHHAYKTLSHLSSYGHGRTELSFWSPFVADHLSGAYIDGPRLLIEDHPIGSEQAAVSFVMRLDRFSDVLDDERRRLRADAEAGVVPPDNILLKILRNIETLNTADAASQHPLQRALESQVINASGMSREDSMALAQRGKAIITDEILPAYARYRHELVALTAIAPSAPGVWQFPRGKDYYADVLAAYSFENVTPEASHTAALKDVAELSETLDIALREQGLAEGGVGERLVLLSQTSLNPDETLDLEVQKQAILDEINTHIQTAQDNLTKWVKAPPEGALQVRPVPSFLAEASPSAFYSPARADGSAPSLLSINMSDALNWPRYTLPTLVFHETFPGHHLEALYAANAETPLLRQIMWNTAYGEGWSVYAEDLVAESNLYADDPLVEIGYLQSLLLRAARVVVDTGLHHHGWSRDDAVSYLIDKTGLAEDEVEREIDRYTVWPGQGASYWLGRNYIQNLRRRAELTLGPKFNLQDFHAAILSRGPRALHLVEQDVERWYKSVLDE